jgi:hypothetical protein
MEDPEPVNELLLGFLRDSVDNRAASA